jgi:hypothetical protein
MIRLKPVGVLFIITKSGSVLRLPENKDVSSSLFIHSVDQSHLRVTRYSQMTHLSDASYVQRFFASICLFIGELIIIWQRDGFQSFNLRRSQHKIKGFSVLLILTSQVLMIVYDGIASYVKYQEGFSIINGNVLPSPASIYSSDNKLRTNIANIILNVSWSLKSSSMFLALAVWNFLVCKLMKYNDFHKSLEFKCYTFYSLLSFALYPTLMILFQHDPLYSTVAPQFVYHLECFMLAIIMTRTNRKFLQFIQGMTKSTTVERINHYILMNRLLIATALADGVTLFIINVDIMGNPKDTTQRLVYNNKFLTDALTSIFSAGFILTYPLVILNMHPLVSTGKEIVKTKDPRSSNEGSTTPGHTNKPENSKVAVALGLPVEALNLNSGKHVERPSGGNGTNDLLSSNSSGTPIERPTEDGKMDLVSAPQSLVRIDSSGTQIERPTGDGNVDLSAPQRLLSVNSSGTPIERPTGDGNVESAPQSLLV